MISFVHCPVCSTLLTEQQDYSGKQMALRCQNHPKCSFEIIGNLWIYYIDKIYFHYDHDRKICEYAMFGAFCHEYTVFREPSEFIAWTKIITDSSLFL